MSNKTIVIIDDDDDIIALLKRILAATGMTVITYKSGKEFLENLIRIKTRIGLLILDLNMPGINGLVVLKKIQEMRKYTKFKVCILSAYNDPAVVAKATELGADGFLIKPVDKAALLIKVRDLLNAQNISMGNDTFAKVNFFCNLLNSPLLLNFYITGVTPERVLIESIFNFKEEEDISFACKPLCEAINYDKEFTIKVSKTVPVRNKFRISGELVGITLSQAQNLKAYIAQNIHEEVSFYEGLGN